MKTLSLMIVFLSLQLISLAQEKSQFNQAPLLASLLKPDGSLNLSAGFNGSIDAEGWSMVTGSNDEPYFIPAKETGVNSSINPMSSLSGDENWDDRFESLGMNNTVHALAIIGSDLYVGGSFTMAGDVSANRIAKWDGSSWSALGSGIDGPANPPSVSALAVIGTDLYVGGGFTTAGGVNTGGIAKWDGSSWSALGGEMNIYVSALAVSGSDLYVGGGFTSACGVNANKIAKWDGSSWSALGSGIDDGVVKAIAVIGSDLYAGGNFTVAGGVSVNYMAKWNGISWSAMEGGMNNTVYALAVIGSDLYAGGNFTVAGGHAAWGIAKWDGSSWLSSEIWVTPFYGNVFALAVSGSDLYVGGFFTTANNHPALNIAKWDGYSFSLGSGVSDIGLVLALLVNGSDLYVGGEFSLAGGKPSYNFGHWTIPPPNQPPTVYTSGPNTVNEGSSIQVSAIGSDPDGDNIKLTVNNLPSFGSFTDNGDGTGMISFSPGYNDAGSYQIQITVTDDGIPNLSDMTTFTLTVNDVNCAPVIDPIDTQNMNEGSTLNIAVNATDPEGDPITFSWDLNNDGDYETSGQNVTFSAENLDGPCTYQVSVKVSDGINDVVVNTNINIINVPPSIDQISAPADPIQAGIEMTTSANFNDPCTIDEFSAKWDWGDGSTSDGEVTFDNGSGTVIGNHTYESAGVFTISLEVKDDDDGLDTYSYQYVVVFNPTYGFVSGAGWIDSPTGAYAADPDLTGRANFGFVSRYQKGKTTPEGNTQFKFNAANFTFHSTNYEWLVISGPNAKFKGVGTINGEGEYWFMVTATDADLTDEVDEDLFRIKIKGNDGVIYDNQMGDDDDAEALNPIGGGKIMVHISPLEKRIENDELQNKVISSFGIPKEYILNQNYPNPFNPYTSISYQLPKEANITLKVYNVLGKEVAILVNENKPAGSYEVEFDATNLPSGIYFYILTAGSFVETKKMVLMK